MVQPVLEDQRPCYIFYRLDERNSYDNHLWIFLAYTPEDAPVMYYLIYTCKHTATSTEIFLKRVCPFITMICYFIIFSEYMYIHFKAPIICSDEVVLIEALRPAVLLTALALLSSITPCYHVYKLTTPTIFYVIIIK